MKSETRVKAVQAVLFDLDGTLVDSAPDLAGAGNEMRTARGLAELPLSIFRPMVGAGARGVVGVALGVGADVPDFSTLRDEFLNRYEQRLTRLTTVFDEVIPVLQALQSAQIPWGIVTNKATRFAEPLVSALGLETQAAVLICGDTTPHSKPHPAPLIEAARRIGVDCAKCLYVGDDLRDVQAGLAAGMQTAAAAWGYLGQSDRIHDWGAHHLFERPADILSWLSRH
jgi:N-acetyl-D-muramate 6-phosphate phosphatase